MNIIQFIRLIKKHLVLLLTVPVVLALLVFYFTSNQPKTYESKATFYTALASGYNFGDDNSGKVDYFGTKIAFDNFINILNSRSTLEDVSIRLFATHLMLDEYDPHLISQKNFKEFQRKVPNEVKELAVKGNLEATVRNLLKYKRPVDTNFIYGLQNYKHPHYSVKAISEVKAKRLNNSDLVEITYQSDDPGICQLTLKLLTESFTENYKLIKANRTDEVIAYFEQKLKKASGKLQDAEDKLLQFNQGNDIINYYEQTKFIADQKEKLDVEVQHVKMERASAKAALKKLESKLSSAQQIRLSSREILALRDSLSTINSRIAFLETTIEQGDSTAISRLGNYQELSKQLVNDLRTKVNELHSLGTTKSGLKKDEILSAWLEQVIAYESVQGSLEVLKQRQEDFLKRYKTFAPLGAKLKRIERQISVSEREYLSILHSLGLARLKEQNIKMQSDVKLVSEPYYPIKPLPSKRKILILAALISGFILILFIILVLEYFDATLRYPARAEKKTGRKVITVFPNLNKKDKKTNFNFIQDRLISILLYHMEKSLANKDHIDSTAVVGFYSTLKREGKSTIIHSLIQKLKEHNKSFVYLNHSAEAETTANHASVENELKYNIKDFNEIKDKKTFIQKISDQAGIKPNYILVELPGIIPVEYPMTVPGFADVSYLIARSNRLWSPADQNAEQNINELMTDNPSLILNGTEMDAVELFLGELPKKRSRLNRILKKILRLQFYSRYKIK